MGGVSHRLVPFPRATTQRATAGATSAGTATTMDRGAKNAIFF